MGSDVIYDIEHVTKKFPGVVALDDITLKIQRGEIFAIVGEKRRGEVNAYEHPFRRVR